MHLCLFKCDIFDFCLVLLVYLLIVSNASKNYVCSTFDNLNSSFDMFLNPPLIISPKLDFNFFPDFT